MVGVRLTGNAGAAIDGVFFASSSAFSSDIVFDERKGAYDFVLTHPHRLSCSAGASLEECKAALVFFFGLVLCFCFSFF